MGSVIPTKENEKKKKKKRMPYDEVWGGFFMATLWHLILAAKKKEKD